MSASKDASLRLRDRFGIATMTILIILGFVIPFIPAETKGATVYYEVIAPYTDATHAGNLYANQDISGGNSALSADDNWALQVDDNPPATWIVSTWYPELDIEPGFTTQEWPVSDEDIANVTITEVIIYYQTKIPAGTLQPGVMQFCTDYPVLGFDWDSPWAYGTWTNSTTFYDYEQIYGEELDDYNIYVMWDVTGYRDWTWEMLWDENAFRIQWLFTATYLNPQSIDYLGVKYEYTMGETFDPGETEEGIVANVYSMIWLVFIFLPGLILGHFLPVIGQLGGLFIMLIILGITEPTFLPEMVMSLAAIAVYLYKGD